MISSFQHKQCNQIITDEMLIMLNPQSQLFFNQTKLNKSKQSMFLYKFVKQSKMSQVLYKQKQKQIKINQQTCDALLKLTPYQQKKKEEQQLKSLKCKRNIKLCYFKPSKNQYNKKLQIDISYKQKMNNYLLKRQQKKHNQLEYYQSNNFFQSFNRNKQRNETILNDFFFQVDLKQIRQNRNIQRRQQKCQIFFNQTILSKIDKAKQVNRFEHFPKNQNIKLNLLTQNKLVTQNIIQQKLLSLISKKVKKSNSNKEISRKSRFKQRAKTNSLIQIMKGQEFQYYIYEYKACGQNRPKSNSTSNCNQNRLHHKVKSIQKNIKMNKYQSRSINQRSYPNSFCKKFSISQRQQSTNCLKNSYPQVQSKPSTRQVMVKISTNENNGLRPWQDNFDGDIIC